MEISEIRSRFNPSQLRLAREIKGLSQGALSKAAQVTPAAVSQYELGAAVPGSAAIARLAEHLEVDPAFFAIPDSGGDVNGFFRSLRSAPASERKKARHYVQLIHQIVMDLETEVRLPNVSFPRLTLRDGASDNDIEDIAASVREWWGVPAGPIENMVRLAERHGLVVTNLSHVDERIDAFSVPFRQRPVVVMSAAKGKRDRSRFDVAHEVGHLVMHDPKRIASKTIEAEAHSFAAAFLMPAQDIRSELPGRLDWAYLLDLKRKWKVSLAALVRRCYTLDKISESSYTLAMKTISARGWRRNEPADLGAPESPLLVSRAMEIAHLTDADISRRTSIPLDLVRNVLGQGRDERPEVVI